MRRKDLTIPQMAGSILGGIAGGLVWQVLGIIGITIILLAIYMVFVTLGIEAFSSDHGQGVLDMGVTMAWMAIIPWFLVGPASKRGPMWRVAAISMAVVSSLFGLSAAVLSCGIASGG